MIRTTLTLGVALAATAQLACSGRSAETASAAAPAAISVASELVEQRPMPRTLSVTGSLIANQQSDVAANASGRVVKTFVERGDFVKEGAPLVQLDIRSAVLSQTEASANLKNAETALTLANDECARNESLFKKQAISKEEWERVNSQCQTSVGAAEAARARAGMAERMLSDATVRAPFSGMIGDRFVSLGEYVQPPSRVARLVELDPLRLQLTVGEQDIGFIHEKQEVDFEVESFPNQHFKGTIKYLDPSVRSATRDLIVEATVSNADHKLRPGMFATAHIEVADQPVVAVPSQAVRRDATTARLFAIVNGTVEERLVQVGAERNGYVAVIDGLKTGERVVTQPTEQVKDGVPVK